MVTYLILVTDASAKGRNVVATIDKVAKKNATMKNSGLIFNRIKDEAEAKELLPLTNLHVLGWIPENETLREFDRKGKSFFDLPEGGTLSSLKSIVQNLLQNHI